MILEFICNIFFALANFFVGILPKLPSFASVNASMAPVFYVIKFINMFVSVKVVGSCLLIVLVIYNIKFVWSILMWLIRKIPGVS